MKKIDFADCIDSFFSTYLAEQRNSSPATASSYSDALTLLVRFIEQETGKSPEKQDLNDLSYDMILRFLDYLEHTRHNSIRTRNTRLMFIRTFFDILPVDIRALCRFTRELQQFRAKRHRLELFRIWNPVW